MKYDIECSEEMEEYFDYITKQTRKAFNIAKKTRKLNYDPIPDVEITIAKNMAERVTGIISTIFPKIKETKITNRIIALEKKYGFQNIRVALTIALEIAQGKHYDFETKEQAIDIGIRTGFTYVTVGIVSSPIEGLIGIDILDRYDKQGQYFKISYAGPIRNAGGTAAATSVLIADYVREKMGYAKYDPTEKEIKRCFCELEDYNKYVTNLQYFPYEKEINFLMNNLPVAIDAYGSESFEISNINLKDIPRITTNKLRGGYCLIYAECLALKSQKLWKIISENKDEFNIKDWDFLEDHIKLQKELKQRHEKQDDQIISEDKTFMRDMVGGRPVLSFPMQSGGFRLRYGRTRNSGFSTQALNPATMYILDNFIAIGTQMRTERPGKSNTCTVCNDIMGPVVRLINGDVITLNNKDDALAVNDNIDEIIYLGDILISYGDFLDKAHRLIPAGYCEEIWSSDLKHALDNDKTKDNYSQLDENLIKNILSYPNTNNPSFKESKLISKIAKIPLHPNYTFFYNEINTITLLEFIKYIENEYSYGHYKEGLTFNNKHKKTLEILGIPHKITDEKILITTDIFNAIIYTFNIGNNIWNEYFDLSCEVLAEKILKINQLTSKSISKKITNVQFINHISNITIKDKSGIFIGARMGRPEKAKMRKNKGSPHGLFPLEDQGGKLNTYQNASKKSKIQLIVKTYQCSKCKNITPLKICELCSSECFETSETDETDKNKSNYYSWNNVKKTDVNFKIIYEKTREQLKLKEVPELIKGITKCAGKNMIAEHPGKGFLRALHKISVNKDGTIRYDATELPITHFKPFEIEVDVAKLREFGYYTDINGKELTKNNQIIELKCQDVILPAHKNELTEGADIVLLKTANFIDDELKKLYKKKAFYRAKNKTDLIGQLIIGLAPHTSAGIVGRIIGWSKTQTIMAHPLFHAAMRRDCDGDETSIMLLLDGLMNFSKEFLPNTRGSTMDAPLVLTEVLNPIEVDDQVFKFDIAKEYSYEFYKACELYKMPWESKILTIKDRLFTNFQFEGIMYTHDNDNINQGILCSGYKTIPSMQEKVKRQLILNEKIRATNSIECAELLLKKQFLTDIKGNLRRFSTQQFRCSHCKEKYRRIPLNGKCLKCNNKLILTVPYGAIVKYLKMSKSIAEKYNISQYTKDVLIETEKAIEGMFGSISNEENIKKMEENIEEMDQE